MKEYDKSMAEANEAIRLLPKQQASAPVVARVYVTLPAPSGTARKSPIKPSPTATRPSGSNAYSNKQEYPKALSDIGQVIRPDPKLPVAHISRGYILLVMKEYDKAIAPLNRGILLDPYDRSGYLYRAIAFFLLNRTGAGDDMKKALEIGDLPRNSKAEVVLVGYFAARRAGQDVQAKKFLDDVAARFGKSDWPFPIVAYLRGDLDEVNLLSAAKDDSQKVQCAAASPSICSRKEKRTPPGTISAG